MQRGMCPDRPMLPNDAGRSQIMRPAHSSAEASRLRLRSRQRVDGVQATRPSTVATPSGPAEP